MPRTQHTHTTHIHKTHRHTPTQHTHTHNTHNTHLHAHRHTYSARHTLFWVTETRFSNDHLAGIFTSFINVLLSASQKHTLITIVAMPTRCTYTLSISWITFCTILTIAVQLASCSIHSRRTSYKLLQNNIPG